MSFEQEIKDYAKQIGMDLCGIAPISRFETSPKGHHPCDLLPGCRSVVSVGVRLTDGVVSGVFRNFEDGDRMAQGIYGTYGYQIGPNFHLLYAVYFIAKFIEQKCGIGTIAMPTHVGPFGAGFHISQRHAAVAAGLGEFGWNSIVLTPEFGPRQRFGAILTTAELEPDPMYEGERLCDPDKCHICTDMCPTCALSVRGEKPARVVEYQDNGKTYHYEYAHVNMSLCRIGAHAMTKKLGARRDYITPDDMSPRAVGEGMKAMMHDAVLESQGSNDLQMVPSWKCGKCLAYCPAGHWKERFEDTGLSKGPVPDKDPFGLLGMPKIKDPFTGEVMPETAAENMEKLKKQQDENAGRVE